jgi:hypothetical protein
MARVRIRPCSSCGPAIRSTTERSGHWTVQHLHPDGHRWFDAGHSVTKNDAAGR